MHNKELISYSNLTGNKMGSCNRCLFRSDNMNNKNLKWSEKTKVGYFSKERFSHQYEFHCMLNLSVIPLHKPIATEIK